MNGTGRLWWASQFGLVLGTALLAQAAVGQECCAGGPGEGSGGGGGPRTALVDVPRLATPIVFDGVPDEAAWRDINPLPMTQIWPVAGAPVSVGSQVWLAYDDEFLYAAGRFVDEPGGVSANTFFRDGWDGDDQFDLLVDSFNDDENLRRFSVNPLGALQDEEITNDGNMVGGQWPGNLDWNTYWEARATRGEDYWTAEMKIPFSSLGFESGGDVVMGVILGRYISRINEKHVFPALTQDQENEDFKASLAQDVRLEGITSSREAVLTPYLLSGVEKIRTPDVPTLIPPEAHVPAEIGGDLRLGLTSNLTLDLTVNTDFAQVESDALQVNLDRFNLFFPEKRQFFQERAGVFQFVHGPDGRLFHSRRIGLDSRGQPGRILGGARLVGRIGEWDVGALSMQVDGLDESGQGGENDAVLRLRRGILNDASTVGAMVTSRAASGGGVDLSVGVDGELNLAGDDFVLFHGAHTANHGRATSFVDGSLARVEMQRRRARGTAWDLAAEYSGEAYDPALGFRLRGDFTALHSRIYHTWYKPDATIIRHRGIFTTRTYLRNEDRSLESGLARFRYQANFGSGHFWNTAVNLTYEDVRDSVSLPGAEIVPGSFAGIDLFTNINLNRGMPLNGRAVLYTGRFMDGWRVNFEVAPTWVVSRHLSATASYFVRRIWFPKRDQRVDADEASLRLAGAVNARLSVEAFLQYSMAARRVAVNGRLRYRFREGQDLWLVMDELRDVGDRPGLDLGVLGRSDRRFLIKYTHAFRR